jgi:hypothetical protein
MHSKDYITSYPEKKENKSPKLHLKDEEHSSVSHNTRVIHGFRSSSLNRLFDSSTLNRFNAPK